MVGDIIADSQATSPGIRRPGPGRKPDWGRFAEAAPAAGLVFGREHDRQHAQGLRRVARVFAPHVPASAEAGPVVIVDLPENLVSAMLERAEVVLAVRVVVRREAVECLHFFTNRAAVVVW